MLNRKEYCSTNKESLKNFKVLGCVFVMKMVHPSPCHTIWPQ